MKCRALLFVSMILFAVGQLMAQNEKGENFQVKGILLDSITHEPEPYATI